MASSTVIVCGSPSLECDVGFMAVRVPLDISHFAWTLGCALDVGLQSGWKLPARECGGRGSGCLPVSGLRSLDGQRRCAGILHELMVPLLPHHQSRRCVRCDRRTLCELVPTRDRIPVVGLIAVAR